MNPDQEKNSKQLYTIRYTINQQAVSAVAAMEELRNELIEEVINRGDFTEAREVLAKIMGKQ